MVGASENLLLFLVINYWSDWTVGWTLDFRIELTCPLESQVQVLQWSTVATFQSLFPSTSSWALFCQCTSVPQLPYTYLNYLEVYFKMNPFKSDITVTPTVTFRSFYVIKGQPQETNRSSKSKTINIVSLSLKRPKKFEPNCFKLPFGQSVNYSHLYLYSQLNPKRCLSHPVMLHLVF